MTDSARFYMTRPESPLVKMQGNNALASKDWYTLFWQLYNAVTNGIPQTESAIPVGPSPFSYQATIKGQINIAGGVGLTIEFTRNGTTFYAAGTVPCMIPMCKGDQVRITYGGAPTLTFFPT